MRDSQTVGVTRHQAFCTIVVAVGSLNFGWNMSATNIPSDNIRTCTASSKFYGPFPSCLNITSESIWGLVVGCYALGALVGAIISNPVIDRKGYKFTMSWFSICNIAGALLLSLTTSSAQFAVGRVFVGIAAGGANTALATYVSDITTPRGRNILGGSVQVAFVVGVVFDNACALGLAGSPRWRILFALTGVFSLLSVAAFPFVTESPKWLLSKSRYGEAKHALQRFRWNSDVKVEFDYMVAVSEENKRRSDDVNVWQVIRGQTPDNLNHQLLCVSITKILQQLSGINAISFYSTTIINKSTKGNPQNTPTLAQILTFAISVVGMLSVFVCMPMSAYVGRRTLLISSHAALALVSALLVVGSVHDIPALVVTMVFLFNASFNFGTGPVPWAIAAEITPRYAMTAVSAIGNAIGYTFVFTIGLIFPPMQAALGNYTFLFFMAWNVVATVFALLFIPETKDRLLEENVRMHSRGVHIVLSTSRASDTSSSGTDCAQ